MISEFLLNIVFNLVEGALSILPNWDFEVNVSFFTSALDMIRLAIYMLPMGTISAIISIVIWLIHFRLIISILKTIWEILPLV